MCVRYLFDWQTIRVECSLILMTPKTETPTASAAPGGLATSLSLADSGEIITHLLAPASDTGRMANLRLFWLWYLGHLDVLEPTCLPPALPPTGTGTAELLSLHGSFPFYRYFMINKLIRRNILIDIDTHTKEMV